MTDTSIQNRRPPNEFYSKLDQCIGLTVKSREAYDEAVDIAKSHGFSDFEIVLFTKEYLKDKIPHSTLYRYLNELKPQPQQPFPLGQIDNNNVLLEATEKFDGLHPEHQKHWNDWVKIKDIKIGKRIRQHLRLDAKPDLVKHIERHGLISPIIVSKNNLLIFGERRLEACKKLGWEIVPVLHDDRYDYDGNETVVMHNQFVEHIVRRVPTIEELREYQKLMKDEFEEEIEFDWNRQKNSLLNEFSEHHCYESDYDKQVQKYEKELDAQIKIIEIEDIINSGQSPEKILRKIYQGQERND